MRVGPELVTNGNFALWDSVGARIEDPTGWVVFGEVANDPEVSEVGTGEGHGGSGTGMCNLYLSGPGNVNINQQITPLVIGRKYRFSMNIDTLTGSIEVIDSPTDMFTDKDYSTIGIKTFTFVATGTELQLYLRCINADDVTFGDVSIKEDIPTELSRTGQHFLSHQIN